MWLCDARAMLKPTGIWSFLEVQIVLFVHTGVLETLLLAETESPTSSGLQLQHR